VTRRWGSILRPLASSFYIEYDVAMKVWIKLLIGSILGILLGFLVPEHQRFFESLAWLEQLVLRIGRYAVVPLLVFSLTIGMYELRHDKQFWPFVFKNLLLIAGVSVLVIFIGVFAAYIFPPSRIPILAEEQVEIITLNAADNITELFPWNMLSVLTGEGMYLLPVCVFAFFMAMGLSYDKNYSKSVIFLVDSLSRIFYHIMSFFIETLGFLMIALAAYWAIRFRDVVQAEIYKNLIGMLGVLCVVLVFIVFPLLLLFLKPRVNPWLVLYGNAGPAITAFFSGDMYFSLPVQMRHAKENFGIKRKSNVISLSLFGTFCRAGSAMVAVVAFIVIVNSYSSLGIPVTEIISMSFRALIISFVLARHPGNGAYVALAVLCAGYGRGFEQGYLILKPMAFYLIAAGTFIDVMIASFAAYATARISGYAGEKHAEKFI